MSIEPTTPEKIETELTPLTFEIEQYRSLRAEILRGMEDGNQVISYGLAAVGIVITAGLTEKSSVPGFLITALLVPLLSSLVLSLWLGTLERIARASFFITGVERRIKKHLRGASFPTWDSWLRSSENDVPQKSHHFWSTEYSGLGLFLCLVILPIALSFFTAHGLISIHWRIFTVGTIIAVEAVFLYSIIQRFARWKLWLTSLFKESN